MFIGKVKEPKINIKGHKRNISKYVYICDVCQEQFSCSVARKSDIHFCSNQCRNQSTILKERRIKTNIEKYGVANPLKNEKVQSKRNKTILDKYGVDNISQLESVKKKKSDTLMENYGISTTFHLPGVQEKIALMRPEINQSIKDSFQNKYGVDNPMDVPEFRNKIIETFQSKYGPEIKNAMDLPGMTDKIENIFQEKYNVSNPMELQSSKDKIKETCLERYGVTTPMQVPEIKNKIDYKANAIKAHDTKKKNGSYGKSKEEDNIYKMLLDFFDESDIIRQFKVNTWSIDFYIPSIELYIQYNGSYYHGLDRPIEIIKNSDKAIDQAIYRTYLRDELRLKYFQENNLDLLILSDLKLI